MNEEIKLVKVEYWRQIKKPTLPQYLYRRAVKEAMASIKGQDGITVNPKTGNPIPISALAAREALKGLTTERILELHPSWQADYKEYVREWYPGKKNG